MSKEIVSHNQSKPITATQSVFHNIQSYNDAKEMAKALAASTFVPETFRGNQNLGNILIAMNVSRQLDVDVLYLMRHLYVIYGKPAFESKFQIAMVNRSGNLKGRLQFEETDGRTRAYGIDANTGERLNGLWVDVDMAKREGWYEKRGSKWQTMPDLMKRYRAASFFINTYMPEVTAGIQSSYDVIDMGDAERIEAGYATPDVPRETSSVGDPDVYEDIPLSEQPTPFDKPEDKKIEEVKEIIDERIPYTTTMGQERDIEKAIEVTQSEDVEIVTESLPDVEHLPSDEEMLNELIQNASNKDELMAVLNAKEFVNLEFDSKRNVMSAWRERNDKMNSLNPEYTDINGEVFDANKHSWSRQTNSPAMNKDGSFRTRRGLGKA